MSDNEIREIFSKNLKYYLELNEKTQADLRRYMGVSSATASDWCNARKIPRTDKIRTICAWLGVELEDLLTEKATKEPPLSDAEKDLLAAFRRLNRIGKAEALKRVSELSQISGYTEDIASLIG